MSALEERRRRLRRRGWVACGMSAHARVSRAAVRVSPLLSAWAGEETEDGHSAHDPATKGRPAWNTGRKLGAKRALKPQQVWAIRSGSTANGAFATGQCSTSPSTANCAAATSSSSRSATSSAGVASVAGQSSSSARPVGRCNSNFSNLPAPASWHGLRPEAEHSTTCLPQQARRRHAHQHPAVCTPRR